MTEFEEEFGSSRIGGETGAARSSGAAPKHTAGPWRAGEDSVGHGVYGCGYRIARMTGGEVYRDRGNARLIAAAPDLLEALQHAEKALTVIRMNVMVEVIGGNTKFEGVPEILAADIAVVRAALSKARGEA